MDATLTMTTPGEVVRRYRKVKGLSQEALAPLVGVTVGMITQYEGDKAEPRNRQAVERIDEVLEAGGRILKAYGFTRPGDLDEELEEMRGQMAILSRQVDELRSIVQDLRQRGDEGH